MKTDIGARRPRELAGRGSEWDALCLEARAMRAVSVGVGEDGSLASQYGQRVHGSALGDCSSVAHVRP